jgi:hypothetical protein
MWVIGQHSYTISVAVGRFVCLLLGRSSGHQAAIVERLNSMSVPQSSTSRAVALMLRTNAAISLRLAIASAE